MRVAGGVIASLFFGCGVAPTESSHLVQVVGPPVVSSAEPAVTLAGEPLQLRLGGLNLGTGARPPTLTLRRIRDLRGNALSGVELSATAPAGTGQFAQSLALATFDGAQLLPGVYAAIALNTTGLEARLDDALVVLPRPQIDSVDHRFYCASDPTQAAALNGAFFALGSSDLASLAFTAQGTRTGTIDGTYSGCRAVPFGGPAVRVCSRVLVPLGAAQFYGDALIELQVDSSVLHGKLDLVRDFFIEAVPSYPQPLPPGSANGAPLVVHPWPQSAALGGDAQPSISLDGTPLPVAGAGCQASLDGSFQICNALSATVPQATTPGAHSLSVVTAAGCKETLGLTLVPVPKIVRVGPALLCQASTARGPISVEGTGFGAGSSVRVDGLPATFLNRCTPADAANDCLSVSAGNLQNAGSHTLTMTDDNSTPPVSSGTFPVTVSPGPAYAGEIPPVDSFSAAETRKVYYAVLDASLPFVSAALTGVSSGRRVDVPIEAAPGGAWITMPALGAADAWRVELRDQTPCPASARYPIYTATDPVIFLRDFEQGVQNIGTQPQGAPPVIWVHDGNPGSAAQASSAGFAGDWYFSFGIYPSNFDRGLVRFDLRARGSGAASSAPGFRFVSSNHQLEYALAAPAPGVWTHYELRLDSADGWTYRDGFGTARPATLSDLAAESGYASVLGSWWPGNGDSTIDNVAQEYGR